MRPDRETWTQWQKDYLSARTAKIDERIDLMLQQSREPDQGTSMDLLGHIDYDPIQRNQGRCGNCWVWAGTGVMEVARDVEDAVFDRLSIQYLNSCRAGFACCGGNLGGFATWYSGEGQTIPWDNANAAFADGGRRCADGASGVACGSIVTVPSHPIVSISDVRIETHDGQANAIADIKNILNQDRAVYFGFSLPDDGAWDDFFDFWDGVGGETEATLWPDTGTYCGDEWVQGEAGGHAVVILGYNDDDADAGNHYWIALNSWGTPASGGRPNGLFRIPTQMNYDCSYPDDGTPGFWAYQFLTLDIEFGNAVPVADANGPYDVACAGPTTTLDLDGTGSSDLDDDLLTYAWTTDCPGGSFDDATSATPQLTVDTVPGCSVPCSVFLTVSDDDGATDTATASVTIRDTSPPALTAPADLTVECDESTDPSNTGHATATDGCDAAPTISYSDETIPGSCPEEYVIVRTWTATDACGNSTSDVQTIAVVDTTAPVLTLPADVTVECDESVAPSDTGYAAATDNCDASPATSYTDVETPGSCPQEKTIARTWTATDACGNSTSGVQTITVVDTTPPVITCNIPGTIVPPDAPIQFTATAADNCDGDPLVVITGYDCFKTTKKGKQIDKKASCVVDVIGDSVTILDTGGAGDHIIWNVLTIDGCGNASERTCEVDVVRKGRR
jgi:hypothetical protein